MSFTWNRNASDLVHLSSVMAPASVTPSADRERLATLLAGFYDYLKANAPTHPQLAGAIDSMQSAVAAYRADSSPDPWAPLKTVQQQIARARALDPAIPEP